jgi:hypothetical protein
MPWMRATSALHESSSRYPQAHFEKHGPLIKTRDSEIFHFDWTTTSRKPYASSAMGAHHIPNDSQNARPVPTALECTIRAAGISITEAREALLRSGNLLEHGLESILCGRSWYVEANEASQLRTFVPSLNLLR